MICLFLVVNITIVDYCSYLYQTNIRSFIPALNRYCKYCFIVLIVRPIVGRSDRKGPWCARQSRRSMFYVCALNRDEKPRRGSSSIERRCSCLRLNLNWLNHGMLHHDASWNNCDCLPCPLSYFVAIRPRVLCPDLYALSFVSEGGHGHRSSCLGRYVPFLTNGSYEM